MEREHAPFLRVNRRAAYHSLVRILIVEDEDTLAAFIARALQAAGFTVAVASDGAHGEFIALNRDVELVVLDVMLPERDGLSVLRAIRARKPMLPVILLTAREGVPARVEGLELGADDYMTKPFALDELVARVRARLRGPGQVSARVLEVGDLSIDLKTRRVVRAGRQVELTAREFGLLTYLMRYPDQVLSREQILSAVWDFDFDPQTKVLEVYIGYLRRKLCTSGRPDPIETVRQVGYRLRAPCG